LFLKPLGVLEMVLEALEVDLEGQEGLEGLEVQEGLEGLEGGQEVQEEQAALEVQEAQGTIWIAHAQFLCQTCQLSQDPQLLS